MDGATNLNLEIPVDRPLDRETARKVGRVCTCFNLRRATRLVTQLYDHTLAETGLRSTQFALLMAAAQAGGAKMTSLAEVLGMDRTTLSRNLKVLEKRGLVEALPGKDRREQRVELTPEGRVALHEALPLWLRAQAKLEEELGGDLLLGLMGGLREVVKALR